MSNFLTVVAFGLVTIGSFAAYSNFGIPQIKPAPPPQEETFDLNAMTVDGLIALGERVFNGKGACTLCHNAVGGRAPLLANAARLASERLADPRYEGRATSAEEYLYESMVEPSAYVVGGFGKTGTNDTVSPMPNMKTSAIALTEEEITAIIAFLQNQAGEEVTVEIPTDTAAEGEGEMTEARRSPVNTVEEAIEEFACGACHKVAGAEGEVGPDLTGIGAIRHRDYLRRAILDPDADIAPGFEKGLMPPDYGQQLYAAELEMLVDYLAELK